MVSMNSGKSKRHPQAIHDLIVEKEPQRVVLEVCHIAGWVVDIAEALGKETETANTTHDAWRWKNVKKKNDREDALKLARDSCLRRYTGHLLNLLNQPGRLWLLQYHQRIGFCWYR